jgi:hypothetical protein
LGGKISKKLTSRMQLVAGACVLRYISDPLDPAGLPEAIRLAGSFDRPCSNLIVGIKLGHNFIVERDKLIQLIPVGEITPEEKTQMGTSSIGEAIQGWFERAEHEHNAGRYDVGPDEGPSGVA